MIIFRGQKIFQVLKAPRLASKNQDSSVEKNIYFSAHSFLGFIAFSVGGPCCSCNVEHIVRKSVARLVIDITSQFIIVDHYAKKVG